MSKLRRGQMGPRRFQVGDKVTATAYTDCFQQHHPAVPGLVVTECRTIESSASHHRVKAIGPDFRYFEAAESAFAKAPI